LKEFASNHAYLVMIKCAPTRGLEVHRRAGDLGQKKHVFYDPSHALRRIPYPLKVGTPFFGDQLAAVFELLVRQGKLDCPLFDALIHGGVEILQLLLQQLPLRYVRHEYV
ncbi:MAG: hypothetical protein FD137_2166, partial [Spirochaetes bacterium]